jgi:uncharacterized protein
MILSLILTLSMVALAGLGIFQIRRLVDKIRFSLNRDPRIDQTLKFQGVQLLLAGLVLLLAWRLNPGSFLTFFRIGNLSAPSSDIAWLGIPAGMPWWQIAVTMGVWITLATTVFMFFQLKKANALGSTLRRLPAILGWVILFSALNAFSEEVIFRLGVVSPLYGQVAEPVLLLLSAGMFGVPHYFGMPKGILGVIMAGFLGWLLAMSLVETQGLFLAWAVHFVQDVVIIASILLIQRKV